MVTFTTLAPFAPPPFGSRDGQDAEGRGSSVDLIRYSVLERKEGIRMGAVMAVVGMAFWIVVGVLVYRRRRGSRAGNPFEVVNTVELGWKNPGLEAEKARKPEDPPAIIESVDRSHSSWGLHLPPPKD